ncbi:MAG: HAD family hydrolase [Acidobacteriaceae bacterium]
MRPDIEAIFIDLGNTLRMLVKDEQHQAAARQKIAALVNSPDPPEALVKILDERYKIYRKWAFEAMLEALESELWTRWLLPEYPAVQIAPLAVELTFQYRQSMGRRVMLPGANQILAELCSRGYRLGIISNVITSREIPDWLEIEDLNQYFQAVVLSSHVRHRKPDPEIYWEASRRIGVPPRKCVYVGDNPRRDVTGTRQAGFGMVILLMDPQEYLQEPPVGDNKPDLVIHEFKQLLDVFPAH